MMGRAAYANPYLLADTEREIFSRETVLSRREVVMALIPYIKNQLAQGVRLSAMTRHILGLFMGQPGAATWRRCLTLLFTTEKIDGSI